MKLRDYQEKAIAEVRAAFHRKVRRVILQMPCGAGKTVVFTTMMKNALANGFPSLMVVRGKELVHQTARRFDTPVNIYQGNSTSECAAGITIASIATLYSRRHIPPARLTIIDECFPPDVEVLTENGFVRFDQLTGEELVAQVDGKTLDITFAKPIRYVKNKVTNKKMVRFKSDRRINISMTENHEVFYKKTNGEFSKKAAWEFRKSTNHLIASGYGKGREGKLSPVEKLMIAYQADGYDHSVGRMYFSFSKERKIKEFIKLMKEGGFSYSEISGSQSKEKHRKYRRRFSVSYSDFRSKKIADHFDIKNLSSEKCREIIEYMVKWDGSIISDTLYYYSSVIKENSDFYCAVACLAGYTPRQTIQIDNRKSTFSDVHRLFIQKHTNNFSLQNVKKTNENYSGHVYCVTIPKGNIIVKSNGKTLVIGNCHLSFGDSYAWLMENLSKDSFVIGTTATPYNSKGFRHIADEIVYPITITELQERGFLVPGKYYSAERPDLSGVKVTAGEFNEGQLGDLMLNRLCADTISSWKKHGEGRPTIVFCVNVKHAESVAELYNRHGVRTVVVDANTNDETRAEIFTALRNGSINCVSSVGVLTTGVDLPEVSCLQILRPTMSEALWFQMLGRGTRTAEGKKNFIVLDHSTNTERFGFIEDERKGNIDPLPKSTRKSAAPNISLCKVCGIIYSGRGSCPECGEEIEIVKKEIEIDPGELKEIKRKELEKKKIVSLVRKAINSNYKRGWVMFALIEKFGNEHGMYLYRKHVMPIVWPTNEPLQRTPQNSGQSDIISHRQTAGLPGVAE